MISLISKQLCCYPCKFPYADSHAPTIEGPDQANENLSPRSGLPMLFIVS